MVGVFQPPNGGNYDIVFDLTGEGLLGHDLPNQLLLEKTSKLAGLLAEFAAERQVKAYVRDTPPFWMTKPNGNVANDETELSKKSEIDTPRAYYFYEAERAAANVEGLPLAILRSAKIYGPHQYFGALPHKIALGEVYVHIKEPMRLLWTGEIRRHALHSRDWCRAAWAAALWTAQRSRSDANQEAGVTLTYVAPSDKRKIPEADNGTAVQTVCAKSKSPVAPVFNLADNDDLTHERIMAVISNVFGIETGFTNPLINAWARLNLTSVVDDANDKHAEAMLEIAAQQNPPLTYTPLTCYLGVEDLAPRAVALDSSKAQKVLGWTPQEHFDEESVRELIESFRKAGAWVRR